MSDLAVLAAEAHVCVACELAEGHTNVVFGVGDPHARVMFIGEGPGREEDLAGEPFVGRSGRLLDRLIDEELSLTRADCYIANVVKCRPPGNRVPKPEEVATCRHFLDAQLKAINPAVVITLGNFASRAVLDTTDGITRLRGKSYEIDGRMILPTFHPAAALRGGGVVLAQMRADFVRAKTAITDAAGTS